MSKHIDVWRMSAGRPWQLEQTHQSLIDHLKFSGEIRFHLIESVLVKEWSDECIEWGKKNGYSVHVISPAKGQGYAVWYALNTVITSPFSLKWEDDFKAEKDIPLDLCVELMEKHQKINQICFNKRTTIASKKVTGEDGGDYWWEKRQEFFDMGEGNLLPLVLKDKWWFGSSLWRTEFIKPIFQYWPSNTHNLFNDKILLPMAGSRMIGDRLVQPSQNAIAEKIGCFIFGSVGDPRMAEHTGRNDSIWAGKYQERAKAEGKTILEGAV